MLPGTLTATNSPSAVLMFMARLFWSIVSMVPLMVRVWVGSDLSCAQAGKASGKTSAAVARIIILCFTCILHGVARNGAGTDWQSDPHRQRKVRPGGTPTDIGL